MIRSFSLLRFQPYRFSLSIPSIKQKKLNNYLTTIRFHAHFCFICLLTTSVFVSTGASQSSDNDPILFDHFSYREGLTSAQVICLAQTKKGFLYMGTESGLVRYDGHTFKSIRYDPADKQSIPGNYISGMFADVHDRLWLNIDNELYIYDTENNKFFRPQFPANTPQRNYHKFKYQQSSNTLWIITSSGIYFSKDFNSKLQAFPYPLTHPDVLDIEFSKDGRIWVTSTYGLFEYFPGKPQALIHHRTGYDPKNKISDGFFCSFLENDSILWLGTWNLGLIKFNTAHKTQEAFHWGDIRKFQNCVLSISPSPFKHESNLLWLGTTSGVFTFNKSNNAFTSYASESTDDKYKIAGSGFCFLAVPNQALWIGTYKGLHKYDLNKQFVNQKTLHIPDLYQYPSIQKICFDQRPDYHHIAYIHFQYKDIIQYDLNTNRQIQWPDVFREHCNEKNEILGFHIDSKNRIWISSKKKGISCFNLANGKLLFQNLANDQLNPLYYYSFHEDQNHKIWFSTNQGIYYFDESELEIKAISEFNSLLRASKLSEFVSTPIITDNGYLIAISNSNNSKKDVLITYHLSDNTFNFYSENCFPAIARMKQLEDLEWIHGNKFALSSFNGIALGSIDTKSLSLKHLDDYNGKFINNVRQLVAENDSTLWFSHDFGVSRLDIPHQLITPFTFYNSNIGKQPCPYLTKSADGKSLIAGQRKSLNIIPFNKILNIPENTIQLVSMTVKNHPGFESSQHFENISLTYQQNQLELQFSLLNFTNPEEHLYQYKFYLEKNATKDLTWESMESNKLNLEGLGPGSYILEARAFNSFSKPSANVYRLLINVKPPFWETIWFSLLIMLLVTGLLISLFRYREIQRKKLEQLRYNIARDLHDDMGSSLSQIKILSELESLKTGNESLYSRIANKLGEVMQNMSEIVWSINPNFDNLTAVVLKIQEFTIQTLETKNIQLKFEIHEPPQGIILNPDQKRHFYLIFKEAVNNILKYSKANHVLLKCYMDHKNFITIIQDDGIGMDPLLIDRGNGMKNMKSRAQALGGTLEIQTGDIGTQIKLIMNPGKQKTYF